MKGKKGGKKKTTPPKKDSGLNQICLLPIHGAFSLPPIEAVPVSQYVGTVSPSPWGGIHHDPINSTMNSESGLGMGDNWVAPRGGDSPAVVAHVIICEAGSLL